MPQLSQLLLTALNGVTAGMLLFLLAAGLILILGVMGIVNMSHGSFYLLGGYVAIAVAASIGSFPLAVLAGAVAVALLGLVAERLFLRRVAGGVDAQVLLTFGFIYILADVARGVWGGYAQGLSTPQLLSGSVHLPGIALSFPVYRLFIVLVGLVAALGLWLFLDRTRYGSIVRAGVDDREMVTGVGVNINTVFTAVFVLGAFLAGLAGALGAPIMPLYPGQDWNILLLAMIILVVGGATVRGALIGSVLVGLIDNFGKLLLPELSMFLLFGVMAVMLALRPQGLFR